MDKQKGFTLIELLVVIAIIGILASVILAALNTTRGKARDAIRKQDLHQIATALELYHNNHGTYIVSGTGANGTGVGWFSYSGGSGYTKSIGQGLVDDGDASAVFTDPLGNQINGSTGTGYLLNITNDHYTIWANLENPTSADTATMSRCYSSVYNNYPSGSATALQTNYCLSE